MTIRPLNADDHDDWLRMRGLLWPDADRDDLARECAEILDHPTRDAVLIAERPDGAPAGFAEVSLRPWAEGCESSPVGYVEAWYVEPDARGTGVGRLLIEAAERWAIDRGCTEMGSDAELWNEASQRAHGAVGYEEVVRLVLFRKTLAARPEGTP